MTLRPCSCLMMALCAALPGWAMAKVAPVVHHNFGKAGNVTFAQTPAALRAVAGEGEVKAVGSPLFFADAPAHKQSAGDGCLLVKGDKSGYREGRNYCGAGDNQVFEVWVKARGLGDRGEALQTVAAHGNGGRGYVFLRQGKAWKLLSGGTGFVGLGPVEEGKWTHLALVVKDGHGQVWRDGKRMGGVNPCNGIARNFSIGVNDKGEEPFHGEIYEVRLSTFKPGAFDPYADFLLDNAQFTKARQQREEARKAMLAEVAKPGEGKVLVEALPEARQAKDWLIARVTEPCRMNVVKSADGKTATFSLSNGLVSRTFLVNGNVACVSYRNLSNEAEVLRAIKPEARLCLDGTWYDVGGLKGQPEKSYLLDTWYDALEPADNAFTLEKVETGAPHERYPWRPKFNAPADIAWPAKGLRVEMTYAPTEAMAAVKDVKVKVCYEIYQGLPVMAKWVEVLNAGDRAVLLNALEGEVLAVNQDQRDRLHVESDYSFALANANPAGSALMHFHAEMKPWEAGGSTTQWRVDGDYHTWASHNQAEDLFLNFPHRCLLVSTFPIGPHTQVSKGKPFKGFITFELLQDSADPERQALAHRRFYRTLAPQVNESLLSIGITSGDTEQLKRFIDQGAEIGAEELNVMAWVGLKHDNLDPKYVAHWKEICDYAKARGMIVGGYELQVASRGRGARYDCISPATGKPGTVFGQSVCIASEWKDLYYAKMWKFIDQTGIRSYEIDGPYHGDVCDSKAHPHHKGYEESQWAQWKTQTDILAELQRRDFFVPIPDWYFLNGQTSTGMGYREASANLSPQQQLLLGRQYIYDGTWHKLPHMGWMTLQLVGFYTRDPRVGLEPLKDNLKRYEQQLFQYLASGCHLCIRGDRLYDEDAPETKAMVKRWVGWYKRYRDILTSEILHVSRPTGRDLDCIMHVNPFIQHRGMVAVFNPTGRTIAKTLRLPLYYTGLNGTCTITAANGAKQTHTLDKDVVLHLPVTIPAEGFAWFLIEE